MGRSQRLLRACFTGHRPDKFGSYAEDSPASKAVRRELRREIERLAKEYDEVEFIAGGALGVDTWGALEVIGASGWTPSGDGISLTLAIPHVGQQNRWPHEAQLKYMQIFKCANKVHWCDIGAYAPWKMMNRNKWMVENSDLVIAVWNGDEKGGTYHCVEYAKNKRKHIINLWPDIEKQL